MGPCFVFVFVMVLAPVDKNLHLGSLAKGPCNLPWIGS